MNERTEVVVVGGGPCGSFSALTAAKLGAEVVLCEEHGEIGVPQSCTGHVSIGGLERLKLHLPEKVVENRISGASFYSPFGKEFMIRCASPVTLVVNRELFDKYLSELAMRTGVQYLLQSRVESFFLESGFVKGVVLRRRGVKEGLSSDIVIDAEGCSSVLLKKAGLKPLDRSMIVQGVQAEVDRVDDVSRDMVEVYLGRKYAPGFFAWIVPRRDASAKVGLATRTGDPREYLHRFMREHPVASRKLREGKVTSVSVHPIPLGGAIPQTYSSGLLIVGDAASQVKPTTGGGIVSGLLCSKIAGEAAYESLRNGDFSEAFLSRYQFRWRELIGFDLDVMLIMRKVLNRLPDEKIDKLISLCTKLGMDQILQKAGDLDFEGRSLFRMARYPTTLIIAFYSLLSSLLR